MGISKGDTVTIWMPMIPGAIARPDEIIFTY